MKHLFAIYFLLAPAPTLAESECMEIGVSDPEVVECASQALDHADAALNAPLKTVLDRLDHLASGGDKGASSAKEQLVVSQEKWLEFRESFCDVIFVLNGDGSIRIPETIKFMTGQAIERNRQLQQLMARQM